jgi:hypothetical protein
VTEAQLAEDRGAKRLVAARLAALRAELVHFHARNLTRPERGVVARFVYGFTLPWRLLRVARRADDFRKKHVLWASVQTSFVVLTAIASILLGDGLHRAMRKSSSAFEAEVAVVLFVFTTLATVEWIVIALSRQYHDQLTRRATLAVGLAPEDPERAPRVTLDFPWLKKRLRRYLRGLIAFAAGVPAIYLGSLFPLVGALLASTMITVWSLYWVGVLTAGKSAAAWRTEGDPRVPDPWIFRVGDEMTTKVPVLKLGLPRLYFKVWRRLSFGLFPPARELEAQAPEMMGVAAFRSIAGLPGLYLFFRPLFPLASQLLVATEEALARGRASARLEAPALSGAHAQAPRQTDAGPHGAGDLPQLGHADTLLVFDGHLDHAVSALGWPEQGVDGQRVALAVEVEGGDRARPVAAHAAVDVDRGHAMEAVGEGSEGSIGEEVGERHGGRA